MITQLSRLNPDRLGMIARTLAMRYKRAEKSIREIGRELAVAYVLEGSVRRESGRVRIAAQLIQVLLEDPLVTWARGRWFRLGSFVLAQNQKLLLLLASGQVGGVQLGSDAQPLALSFLVKVKAVHIP